MSFFLIFALQCLFPIFDSGAGEWVGLSVVNTDSQVREFTVTATSPDGNTTQRGRLSLAPGEQRARLLGEILDTASPLRAGWIRIDSALSGCSSYMAAGNDAAFIGMDAPAVSGTPIVLPHVTVNTGFVELAHTDTAVAIVNSGSNGASVTAQLFGLDGSVRATAPFTVTARGSLVFKVSEVFREAMPANNAGGRTFIGYVRLASDVPIAAWQRIETPLTRSALRGRAPGETPSTTSAMFPHFFFDGSYEAILNVVNPSSVSVALELTATDNRGNAIGETRNVTLAPGQGIRGAVGEFFRVILPAVFPPPRVEGQIRIRSANGAPFQIAGDVEMSTYGTAAAPSVQGLPSSVTYPIQAVDSTLWLLPFAIASESWATSYAVVNPNELSTVQTDVQVEAVRSDGVVVSRTPMSLSPRTRQVANVAAPFPAGYLRVKSNFPVVIAGTVRTADGSMLDQIPPVR